MWALFCLESLDWALVLGRHHRHTRMQTNFALTVRQRQVLLVVESDHDVASFRADLGENLEVGGWIVDGLLAGSRCQFFVPFGSHLLELAYIVFQELAKPLFSHSLLVCVNVCVCVCARARARARVCVWVCVLLQICLSRGRWIIESQFLMKRRPTMQFSVGLFLDRE